MKEYIDVQENKKEVVVLCSRLLENVTVRHFYVIALQRRQRNVQKSDKHVQSRHPRRPMQGQILGAEGKTKRAEKKRGEELFFFTFLRVIFPAHLNFPSL